MQAKGSCKRHEVTAAIVFSVNGGLMEEGTNTEDNGDRRLRCVRKSADVKVRIWSGRICLSTAHLRGWERIAMTSSATASLSSLEARVVSKQLQPRRRTVSAHRRSSGAMSLASIRRFAAIVVKSVSGSVIRFTARLHDSFFRWGRE